MKLCKKLVVPTVLTALATPVLLAACDRQVSSEKQKTVNSDGSTKSKEKSTTESSDGTVTKEEKTTTTPPTKP